MRPVLLLALCVAAATTGAASTPELLPVHDGQQQRAVDELPEGLNKRRALLSVVEEINASVNSTLVDPFRIVRDPLTNAVVGQVTSDAATSAAVNATELCIFLNASIPVDNETYSVEAFARQDDINASLVVVSNATVQVVNASYYCANVTAGTYFTALVEAAATPSAPPGSESAASSSTTAISAGVIAAIVIASVFGGALVAVVLALVIRPPARETVIVYEDDEEPLSANARIEYRRGRRPVRGVRLPSRGAVNNRPGHRAQMRFDVRQVRHFQ